MYEKVMAIFYFYFQLFCTRIILVTVLNRKNLSIMTDIWRKKKKKGKTETIILVNLWKNVIIEKKNRTVLIFDGFIFSEQSLILT